jgi:hypothetical protein
MTVKSFAQTPAIAALSRCTLSATEYGLRR